MKFSSLALLSLVLGSFGSFSLVSGTVICNDASPIDRSTIHDDVQVPKDATCDIINGATIHGKLTLKQGSTALIDSSTVTGDVKGDKIAQLVATSAVIGGNVKVTDSPHTNNGDLDIRLSQVKGNIEIKDNGFNKLLLQAILMGTDSKSSKVVIQDNTVNGEGNLFLTYLLNGNVSKVTVKGNRLTGTDFPPKLLVQYIVVNGKITVEDNISSANMFVQDVCASDKIVVKNNRGLSSLECDSNRENEPDCPGSGPFASTISASGNTFPTIEDQCVEAPTPSPPSKSSKGGYTPPTKSSKSGGTPPTKSSKGGVTSKGRQRNLRRI